MKRQKNNVVDFEKARMKRDLELDGGVWDEQAFQEAEEEQQANEDRRVESRLVELYVEQRLGIRGVAKRMGISPTHARKLLCKHGINRRPQMRHPELQRDFFDCIDTPEKAYVLGLIWADGTLSEKTQQVRVRLAVEDVELLTKIGALIGITKLHPIPPAGNAVSWQVGLYISSKQIVNALLRLGLTEAKDYTLPQAVLPSETLRRDFVRGLIDGDGCLQMGRGVLPRLSFRNRNASLRGYVAEYLESITGQPTKRDGSAYPSVYLSGAASVIAAKILYGDADLALERKRRMAQKFATWIPHRRGRLTIA